MVQKGNFRHLIDSGLNNLQRFTRIQYEARPFLIQPYNQDESVTANLYQTAEARKLIDFWTSINYRILDIIKVMDTKNLSYTVVFTNGEKKDLKFLIEDYLKHLEHHLNQIIFK